MKSVWEIIRGVLLVGMVMLAGCGGATTQGQKPTAVTAIFAYYDALRAIGGEDMDAVILLPAGNSPHDYEPTLKDKVTMAKAKLVVINGLNIDAWAVKMAADNPGAIVINVSTLGIEPLHTAEVSIVDAREKGPAEDVSAGNPHIWLDPRVQMKAAEAIRDALVKIDSAHADGYKQRAGEYLQQLEKLDADFALAAKGFKQKDFIGFHSAYAYLAHRFGLNQVASVEEIPGEGPTVSETVKIINLIKEKGIKVIFVENAFPAKAADMIVRETGVSTGILQPLETYDDVHQTYVGLMRENLESLKKALN